MSLQLTLPITSLSNSRCLTPNTANLSLPFPLTSKSLLLISSPHQMTIEPLDPNSMSELISDWLEDTISFLPSFLDDPYSYNDYQWWDHQSQSQSQDQYQQQLVNSNTTTIINSTSSTSTTVTTTTTTTTLATADLSSSTHPVSDQSKKRKVASQNQQFWHQRSRISDGVEEEDVLKMRRSVSSSKKAGSKANGVNNCSNRNNKEGRWAEQLLNPCAVAITNGDLTRVQHLLNVIHELASYSGDANHRLAAHGLHALSHHLSTTTGVTSSMSLALPMSFASTEPRLFQRSLLKFHEVSPWFTFPNTVANNSILQVLSQEPDSCSRNLHILDIGVSHGLQWPTFLEALSRRSGGPPPLLRITIMVGGDASFSKGPPGDDFPSRLLRFAKTINLNLQINLLNNQPLQTLTRQIINSISSEETLIVCAQFRLHHLSHTTLEDDRMEFLRMLRSFEPKAVILCENDMECSCNSCGDFTMAFSRRVEYLWHFLDSTSAAFKGRECEERRVVEGEAANAFLNGLEMNEGKDKWCEKMRGVGFKEETFGEDPIDGGRALLRKYDSNWEMRVDEKDGRCVCLWWRGQPVSFCSLWTLEKTRRKPSIVTR